MRADRAAEEADAKSAQAALEAGEDGAGDDEAEDDLGRSATKKPSIWDRVAKGQQAGQQKVVDPLEAFREQRRLLRGEINSGDPRVARNNN